LQNRNKFAPLDYIDWTDGQRTNDGMDDGTDGWKGRPPRDIIEVDKATRNNIKTMCVIHDGLAIPLISKMDIV